MPISKLSNYTGTEGFDQQNTEEKQQKYLRDVDYDIKRLFDYVNQLQAQGSNPLVIGDWRFYDKGDGLYLEYHDSTTNTWVEHQFWSVSSS